eukprot:scaffold72932_cov84-Cyclotella_meneghiniana.AAC.3
MSSLARRPMTLPLFKRPSVPRPSSSVVRPSPQEYLLNLVSSKQVSRHKLRVMACLFLQSPLSTMRVRKQLCGSPLAFGDRAILNLTGRYF